MPVKILFVGSVDKRKRPDLLLDFAGSLPAEKAEFHIVGSLDAAPDYAARLLARKRDEHLDHVYFHGSRTQAEVREWMWSSDLSVLPSRLEGVGRVNVEAAAAGLPCIVFDDYHTPGVLDGKTGFQVRTEQEMADRLAQLVDDAELRLRMGAAAADHARQFDATVVAKQWEALFAELAGSKP